MNSTTNNNVTQDTTDSFQSALNQVLEKVEELNLNEGNYLKMTNLLKKCYEEEKKTTANTPRREVKPMNLKIVFCGKKEFTFNFTEYTRIFGPFPDEYKYDLNGVQRQEKQFEISQRMQRIYRMNLTKTIKVIEDDIEFQTTLKEFKRQVAEMNEDDDDDNDEIDYNLTYIFGMLIDRDGD
jgi:hypothetical protein